MLLYKLFTHVNSLKTLYMLKWFFVLEFFIPAFLFFKYVTVKASLLIF